MTFRWYQREAGAALRGMEMLSLEESGAYNKILDLIYLRWGPIPDDAVWLSGHFRCSKRKAELVVRALIRQGKIYRTTTESGVCLMNERADFEIVSAETRSKKFREFGKRGAELRWKRNEINEDVVASPKPGHARPSMSTSHRSESLHQPPRAIQERTDVGDNPLGDGQAQDPKVVRLKP